MKYVILFFCVSVLVLSCGRFPSNPAEPESVKTVFIEHRGTEYVPASSSVEGIAATKVNVLSFDIRAENFVPKTLEFYGVVILDGPPEYREHSLYFLTDTVFVHPEGTGYTFNTLDRIEQGKSYTLIRPKFPTNEYSPFEDTQGMVTELAITEVWAADESGQKFSVAFCDSL